MENLSFLRYYLLPISPIYILMLWSKLELKYNWYIIIIIIIIIAIVIIIIVIIIIIIIIIVITIIVVRIYNASSKNV